MDELVLGIYDRGREPTWRADRSRFGAWRGFEAELSSGGDPSAVGCSPWQAGCRLIAAHREIAPGTQPERRETR